MAASSVVARVCNAVIAVVLLVMFVSSVVARACSAVMAVVLLVMFVSSVVARACRAVISAVFVVVTYELVERVEIEDVVFAESVAISLVLEATCDSRHSYSRQPQSHSQGRGYQRQSTLFVSLPIV
jgi:hypothetical protein